MTVSQSGEQKERDRGRRGGGGESGHTEVTAPTKLSRRIGAAPTSGQTVGERDRQEQQGCLAWREVEQSSSLLACHSEARIAHVRSGVLRAVEREHGHNKDPSSRGPKK